MADDLVRPILAEYDRHLALYTDFTKRLRQLIEELLQTHDLAVHSVFSRIKDKGKLEEKITRSAGKYSHLPDITDVSGVRVITYFSDEVDQAAKIIEEEFDIDRENSLDPRATQDPDRFGYLSLHYIVSLKPSRIHLAEYRRFASLKAEVQIRSILQHAWAEIEHDRVYKTEVDVPRDVKRGFSQLAGLLELADTQFVRLRDTLRLHNRNLKFAEVQAHVVPPHLNSHQLLRQHLAEALNSLEPRERRVLQLRFGLEDGKYRTPGEVALEFGVSTPTINRITATALRKLRHPSSSFPLRD